MCAVADLGVSSWGSRFSVRPCFTGGIGTVGVIRETELDLGSGWPDAFSAQSYEIEFHTYSGSPCWLSTPFTTQRIEVIPVSIIFRNRIPGFVSLTFHMSRSPSRPAPLPRRLISKSPDSLRAIKLR
ncbi:hypothetical protein OROGR_013499 [Orobanche gracilis]